MVGNIQALQCFVTDTFSFQQCPRFPGVHHFKNGVTSLKYITGTEHGQILRVSPILCEYTVSLI